MYVEKEISKHNRTSDAWVVYEGKILDITGFLPTHPGGDSVLHPYLGKDITEAFKVTNHSESAEGMLESLVIGKSENKSMKIDPYKGTLYQIWSKLDLKSYTDFVNSPNSVIGHMRVFDSPYLEIFSMTHWKVIPALWIPVALYFFCSGFLQIGLVACLAFCLGVFYWTFFEYLLHRYGFHCEQYLPDNRYMLCLHYLMHGIHHAFPMDSLRLVFPPVLGIMIAIVFKTGVYNLVMPLPFADAFFAGKVIGYVWYDLFHYFSHHRQAKNGYTAFMKRYHLAHHYKNPNLGFGVSSHIWDIVFGTRITLTNKTPQVG